jgi:hypothetical protein
MITTYGRVVTVSDRRADGTYRVGCSEHGLIKTTKQAYRAHTYARAHAHKEHGRVYEWTHDDRKNADIWYIDAPNDLHASVWTTPNGEYLWVVVQPAPRDVSGRIASGTSANLGAAQVSSVLAIADHIGPLL